MVIQTERAGGPAMESMLYAADGNWRLENVSEGFLHKARQEGHFVLYHDLKGYREVEWKPDLIAERVDGLAWERTRIVEKIAGVPARKWIGKKGGRVRAEVWFGGTANYFEDLADETQGVRGAVGDFLPSVPGKFPLREGYILKFVQYNSAGKVTRRTQVRSFARTEVDAKWFELPADYAIINPPPEPIVPGDPEPPPLLPQAAPGD
jgi:hypothetical protein